MNKISKREATMKYPNECKCGKPTNGKRMCAACKGEAKQEDSICKKCSEKFMAGAVFFDATAIETKRSIA